MVSPVTFCIFFFNDTATTEIYTRKDTLSLHDALPICPQPQPELGRTSSAGATWVKTRSEEHTSELQSPFLISYAVFCLKKKKKCITQYSAECAVFSQRNVSSTALR